MRPAARRIAATLPLLAALGPPLAAQETHLLVVSGLGGEPEYSERFVEWGLAMTEAAREAGVPEANVQFLAEDPGAAPGRIDGRSEREAVERAFAGLAADTAPDDRILVLLIGHGGGAGEDSRVSMPGRSLRASEYRELVGALAPRTVAVVNLASASGDFVPALSGEGRIVVTATRSSRQRNAALFGGYFVEAYGGADADTDRDGRISLLEAFEYARIETDRYYADRGLIASETALLEDRIEGRGEPEPGGDPGVGQLAARFFLESAVPAEIAGDDPSSERLRALYGEQARLEDEVARLRQAEGSMTAEAYRAALEALLVALAETGAEIRALEAEP